MLAALLLAAQTPVFDFEVTSGNGLTISTNGIPLVRGSWFQYYEPGWVKGYYSSLSSDQKIERIDANTVRMSFSENGTNGWAKFTRSGNQLTAEYQYGWSGASPVLVEAGALLWAPAFQQGTLTADGKPTRPLDVFFYNEPGIQQRRFSPDARTYVLDSPVAKVTVQAEQPSTLFDARGYDQSWAEGTQVWWLGNLALEATKDKPATARFTWTIEPKAVAVRQESKTIKLIPTPTKVARVPDLSRPLLVPRPKQVQLDWNKPLVFTGKLTFPAGRVRFMGDFSQALARRFQIPPVNPASSSIEVDAGVSKLGLKPGGYRITVGPGTITVLGEEDEGLRNGWRRLAQMAFVQNGKICLPTGTIVDQPTIQWRGVHLFVGPEARAFQRNLWERVLLPMGFNNVVLQCEQTDWRATPGIATANTMKREDLAALFQTYRNWLVEPTPLIQSWGHVEWLFRNGRNRGIMFNPEVPYSLDPRKPEAKKTIEAIWDEAAALLEPKTLHFGLDEVDMRGWPDDPELVTSMWEEYLPFLTGIAKKHNAKPALWGDKMLAPGEAPDAALGHNKEHAARRRAVLQRGTTVFDWHYKPDSDPRTFYPSLRLFKNEGLAPIASGWYRPANIKGLATAADILEVGYLQTTWAGYYSNEQSMIQNLPQYSAMILAAEYAWGGREESPDKIGYDASDLFRRLYFGLPSPLSNVAGTQFRLGPAAEEPLEIEGVRFDAMQQPIAMHSPLSGVDGPSTLILPISGAGRSLWLALDTDVQINDGEPVGYLEATLIDGKKAVKRLIYGQDVRAQEDLRPAFLAPRQGTVTAVRLGLPAKIQSLQIRTDKSLAGLRIHGVTLTD